MKLDITVLVVHEIIYRYIYAYKANGGRLYKYLRHKNKARGIIIDRTMLRGKRFNAS